MKGSDAQLVQITFFLKNEAKREGWKNCYGK